MKTATVAFVAALAGSVALLAVSQSTGAAIAAFLCMLAALAGLLIVMDRAVGR